MLKLLESWGEEILKILPETILRILWVIFLVSIMKYVVKISAHALKVLMEKSNADELLISFMLSLTKTLIYIGFFFLLIGSLGVRATSLLTVLGTAGLAIDLTLQGSLSSLTGGVLILFSNFFSKRIYKDLFRRNEIISEEIKVSADEIKISLIKNVNMKGEYNGY